MNEQETEVERITLSQSSPVEVVKTTKMVTPSVQGQPPQKVYETKKTIFRFNQVIWYILGLIETLLVFRIVLKALGANPTIGFTSFINALTQPLAGPFAGIFTTSITGSSVIEWSTIVAIFVYLCFAWGLVYLLDLVYPITPKDVERQ